MILCGAEPVMSETCSPNYIPCWYGHPPADKQEREETTDVTFLGPQASSTEAFPGAVHCGPRIQSFRMCCFLAPP